MYLVGEPVFDVGQERKTFLVPTGQMRLCLEVLKETRDVNKIHQQLATEYLAIIYGLKEMGVEFRIIYSHPDKIAMDVVEICARLECRFVQFQADFYPPSVVFPRDFSTILPGTLLVNEYTRVLTSEKNGWKLIVSPWGEGGRVLVTNNHVAVPERICSYKKGSFAVDEKHLEPFRDAGMKVLFLPLPLMFEITATGEIQSIAFNDHLDLVAFMILDKNNNPHLIVDPNIRGRHATDKMVSKWKPLNPKETISVIQERATEASITFHVAPLLQVPYSLNLLQDDTGQILMTSGEEGLASLVGEIVGKDMVVRTPIPIRYFPAWAYAGIRCLVNEAPTPLLIKK